MKSIDLKANLRKSLGKKDAQNLRKAGLVPCVLYGGSENLHLYAHENTFKNLVYTHNVYLINLDIEGDKRLAIMKEIQFHPLTDKIIHIDFQEVFTDKLTVVDLPVDLKGNSVGIKAGGKLRQRKRYLKVKGLLEHMPDSLVVDITELDIGQSILASDVQYDNLEILEPSYTLVVGVVSSPAQPTVTVDTTITTARQIMVNSFFLFICILLRSFCNRQTIYNKPSLAGGFSA